ncbi:Hydrolase tropI [Paramyrothecium foliicola]|nr:Hydrolase tropI [Paramyrothecium foliicola]
MAPKTACLVLKPTSVRIFIWISRMFPFRTRPSGRPRAAKVQGHSRSWHNYKLWINPFASIANYWDRKVNLFDIAEKPPHNRNDFQCPRRMLYSWRETQLLLLTKTYSGDPKGKMTRVADSWDAYIASPSASQARDGAGILFLTDALGLTNNSKLLADAFAGEGLFTMVVDLFNGDPIPADTKIEEFDIMKWLTEGSDGKNPHTADAVDPIITAAINSLIQDYKIEKLGAVGYCFGGKVLRTPTSKTVSLTDLGRQYVVRHYKSGIKAGYVAHPSLIEEGELSSITGPLSIAAAEVDDIFTAEHRHKSEEILARVGQPYQVNLFGGVAHGFAVRGDMSNRIERFSKEQAFNQAISWFAEFL